MARQDANVSFGRHTRRNAKAGMALGGTALLASMFAISMGYAAPSGQEEPKVTDWMQAWGSILGVVAGVGAAIAAGWLLLHEREQARLAQAAQQRESDERYAELVTWYLREKGDDEASLRRPVDAGDFWGTPPDSSEAVLVILNNSHGCIYEVVVSIPEFRRNEYRDFSHLADRGLGTIPPGRTEIAMPMRGYRNFHGSGSFRTIRELPSNAPVEYLRFRDPADRSWQRTGRGELIRLPYTNPGTDYPDHSP
ncbi:hypothetical protein ABZ647_31320 [Micromonospora aurantiaca]|uniref:hypothetical protein n=1 Tax=Micromonospora aurantiaca (nom. illeg.) TaxID=47850 RepID=UPI003408B73D